MSTKRQLETEESDEAIPQKKIKNRDGHASAQQAEENKDDLSENILIATIKTGQNKTSAYKYIDTTNKFQIAMDELNNCIDRGEMIAVDCEGDQLSRFGSITMINIASRNQVYLIDVMQIGDIVYDQGLRSLLENNSINKLMFDCREDSDALYHLHEVKLDGVLDIQLLEVWNIINHRGCTKIKSLKHCLELYISDNTLLEMKLQGIKLMASSDSIWKKRPLNEILLKYASIDVISLFELYDALSGKNDVVLTRWKEASARYCDYQRSKDRKCRDGDGVLPPGII